MSTRIDAAHALRGTVRGGTDERSNRRLARGLPIGEVALAAALLAGAAQLVRTFVNLTRADRGLNADGVITGWVALPEFAFADRASRLTFAAALEDRLRQMPGVQQVTLSGGVPPGGGMLYFGAMRSGEPGAAAVNAVVHGYRVTGPFFDLFGISLLSGRTFTAASPPDEVILGEQLASRLFPGGGAVLGVLSAAVARRRREFGIRVALGIEPARLTRLVLGDAARLAALGLVFGVAGAWMLGRALASLTYGVSPADPATWAAVLGSLTLTTLLAAWRPGRQAARVDPAELLRSE